MSLGVCIVKNSAKHRIDGEKFTAAGFLLRSSTNCVPDVIFSYSGTTIAVIGTAATVDARNPDSEMWIRMRDKVVLILLNPEENLSDRLVQLFNNLSSNADPEPSQASDQTPKAEMLGSVSVNDILRGVNGCLGDHDAHALRMLGSIRDIACANEQDIINNTDMLPDQARKVYRFFENSITKIDRITRVLGRAEAQRNTVREDRHQDIRDEKLDEVAPRRRGVVRRREEVEENGAEQDMEAEYERFRKRIRRSFRKMR
ncbi:hypothetical protein BSKO_06865 [Bryopsis sp. KO-2023]|nr:hypothetical protein BSKO_06865 [Bryopsis sp. KO-2023]